jgi:hypothetical protein
MELLIEWSICSREWRKRIVMKCGWRDGKRFLVIPSVGDVRRVNMERIW